MAREGVRWHLVEQTAGQYDFSSALPIVRAARATGTQVIWDLCHFGWPDHLDIFKPEFVSALAELRRGLRPMAGARKRTDPGSSCRSTKSLSSPGPRVTKVRCTRLSPGADSN